ncbi:MAG: helix-turn-helix domain-containing protein [candidate division Zixibacteria bacterium]|nr:helix-turn-helix domain-containing protein [candidate division Zixibacteria bacterium]
MGYKDVGEALRNARLKLNLNYEEIQDQIKINIRFLEAMENERFDQLPGEAYITPFLKTYSEFLGVDISDKIKSASIGDDEEYSRSSDSIKKTPIIKRWMQVAFFYIIGFTVIIVFAYKSSFINIYSLVKPDTSQTISNTNSDVMQNLLLELVVFDTSMVTVVSGSDTLFSDTVQRGMVKRFTEWDSYLMTISPRNNVRIFTNDSPLYFPANRYEDIPILKLDNFNQYIDTLLLGESIQ